MTIFDRTLSDPTMTVFDSLYLKQDYRYGLLNCPIKIWDRYFVWFVNYALFSIVGISSIFGRFFIITFERMGNFKFFHRKKVVQIYPNPFLFILNRFFIHKNRFLGEKWFFIQFCCIFFFKNYFLRAAIL